MCGCGMGTYVHYVFEADVFTLHHTKLLNLALTDTATNVFTYTPLSQYADRPRTYGQTVRQCCSGVNWKFFLYLHLNYIRPSCWGKPFLISTVLAHLERTQKACPLTAEVMDAFRKDGEARKRFQIITLWFDNFFLQFKLKNKVSRYMPLEINLSIEIVILWKKGGAEYLPETQQFTRKLHTVRTIFF